MQYTWIYTNINFIKIIIITIIQSFYFAGKMSSCSPQCLSPPHCATAYYGHSPRSPPYAPPQPAPPQYPPPTRSLSNSTATHDKLPSYFTELSFRSRLTCPISRPSSARLAVAAATRPTSKLRRRDLSPQFDRCHDKVPSYLSCFTNSTKYDGLTCYRYVVYVISM